MGYKFLAKMCWNEFLNKPTGVLHASKYHGIEHDRRGPHGGQPRASGQAATHSQQLTASIENIKFELIDLDTTDGIAPALTWADDLETTVRSSTYPTLMFPGVPYTPTQAASKSAASFLAPLDLPYTAPNVSGAATSGADFLKVTLDNQASPTEWNDISLHADADAGDLRKTRGFTLTPNTTLRITGYAQTSYEVDDIPADLKSSQNAYAAASLSLYSFFTYSDGQTTASYEAGVDRGVGVNNYDDLQPLSKASGGLFDIQFSNRFSMPSEMELTIGAHLISSYGPARPVPEPEGVALCIAGLALVGLHRARVLRRGQA